MAIPPSRNVGDAGHTTDHNSITAELTSQAALIAGKAATSHSHAGTDIASGTVPAARLGTGSSITTKYLRGDNTWQTISTDLIDHTHAATDLVSGFVSTARLGSGSASSATFLRGDGEWATPTSTSAPGAPALLIASAISTSKVKARADVVCDGTNDAAQINAAITAATNQIVGAGATKYGGIILADGVYRLNTPILIPCAGFSIRGQGMGTILMRASGTFTDAGQGSVPALIKMASTPTAQAASSINISDLYLLGANFANYGASASASSSSRVTGIYLEVTTATNVKATYGHPVAAADADGFSRIRNVTVENCSHGIYISGSYARHNFIEGCVVHTVADGCHGFYMDTSDNEILNCTAAGDAGDNSYGFNISGGSNILTHCKAFYYDGSGSRGYSITSSRASITACEAQDSTVGFYVTGSNASLVQCRCDTQETSTTAFDLSSADYSNCIGLIVAMRSGGTYTNGIALPADQGSTAGWMQLSAFVDPTLGGSGSYITRPVSKNGTNVTASSALPTGLDCHIVVRGVGSYVQTESV